MNIDLSKPVEYFCADQHRRTAVLLSIRPYADFPLLWRVSGLHSEYDVETKLDGMDAKGLGDGKAVTYPFHARVRNIPEAHSCQVGVVKCHEKINGSGETFFLQIGEPPHAHISYVPFCPICGKSAK